MNSKFLKKAIITIVAIALFTIIIFYFFLLNNRSTSLPQPEEEHLIGDGVYFNIFTEETKGKEITGIFSNVNNDTIFYASIQNSGQDRLTKLTCYINYVQASIEFLDSTYTKEDIHLQDGDNIIIPFKIKTPINSSTNSKMLCSLSLGIDQHESDTKYQTTQHTISYDYLIQNNEATTDVPLNFFCDKNTNYSSSSFPGIVLNTDFTNTSDVKLPPYELTVSSGKPFDLSYKLGYISSDTTLLLITIDYEQAKINNDNTSLLIKTPNNQLASGTISLTAPSSKGKYELCAIAIPSPNSLNAFEPLENSYRFTLNVI